MPLGGVLNINKGRGLFTQNGSFFFFFLLFFIMLTPIVLLGSTPPPLLCSDGSIMGVRGASQH